MKKKRKTLYKKIIIPIYDKSVHICIADNVKKANKVIKKKELNEKFEDGDLSAKAIVSLGFEDENKNYGAIVVFTPEGLTHGTIAHETYHITNALLKSTGLKRCDASEEAYSYLQEYLVKEITTIIKQKGFNISE